MRKRKAGYLSLITALLVVFLIGCGQEKASIPFNAADALSLLSPDKAPQQKRAMPNRYVSPENQ